MHLRQRDFIPLDSRSPANCGRRGGSMPVPSFAGVRPRGGRGATSSMLLISVHKLKRRRLRVAARLLRAVTPAKTP